MGKKSVMLITGTSRGIGRHLARYYTAKGFQVIGCSRNSPRFHLESYQHFCADITDESAVKQLFMDIAERYGRLDVLINNAGIASMNHILLTPVSTVTKVLNTNVMGVFLFCREAVKLMRRRQYGRIVNFATVATPLKLEGEAIYAASKAAVISLTQILAYELASFGVTVNAVGPAPVKTDLVQSVPPKKMEELIAKQAIKRWAQPQDIANVIDFFIHPKSELITGQVVYLGGVS